MRKILSIILFVLATSFVYGQQTTPGKPPPPDTDVPVNIAEPTDTPRSDKIFTAVETEPTFPGGLNKLDQYISNNVKYPPSAIKDHREGTVFVSFIIDNDGTLTDFKISRSVSPELDAEAIRLMKACPRWNPGIQNGRKVRVAYTIPIAFKLPK